MVPVALWSHDGKKKQSKKSLRLFLRDAKAIDSGVGAEEKQRRAIIRDTLRNLKPRQGWDAVQTTLQDHISQAGFYRLDRLKKQLKNVDGDVNLLDFPKQVLMWLVPPGEGLLAG